MFKVLGLTNYSIGIVCENTQISPANYIQEEMADQIPLHPTRFGLHLSFFADPYSRKFAMIGDFEESNPTLKCFTTGLAVYQHSHIASSMTPPRTMMWFYHGKWLACSEMY
ncbi:22b021d9-4791-4548-b6fe-fff9fabf0fec [Sclerotinia trifoliorum]|uniref:22b021d9-4791-4548-b6fe-fff9fabf0fec n=1 Tax=Sclerotinia trifoliorum TaxID=28548 RepID=A0A8H2ZNF6_9HELO|nr:22b021d9-4791-4548-b6fe-fff9fabf0fec [Sclerotinia trifoliorum]